MIRFRYTRWFLPVTCIQQAFYRILLPNTLSIVLLSVLCGCTPDIQHNGTTYSHDAYIWQRQWTPAVKTAIANANASIANWHILAAEVDKQGMIQPVVIDVASLKLTEKPVIPVIRINGQRLNWASDELIEAILGLAADWRKAGLNVSGLEIDHDCATRRLPEYIAFLDHLRLAISDQQLPVIITALPTWLDSQRLSDLLAKTDGAVLQVHAVSNPLQGLFNPQQAADWVKRFSAISPIDFRVALPNYGSRIGWDTDGRISAVESETPVGLTGPRTKELIVTPQSVATFINNLRQTKLPGLQGFVWFRLPTADDQRAWSLGTWQAVMAEKPLQPKLTVTAIPAQPAGVFDIVLHNESDIDGPAPLHIQVANPQRCAAADGLGNYSVRQSATSLTFHLIKPSTLPAHHYTAIGWIRCPNTEVQVNVTS